MTWLFGYGSIMWKTGFVYTEQRLAMLPGYTRRFWQGSMDHRGTPEFPGRVVTLIPDPSEHCWGMAFRLNPESADIIMADLDYREKGGYERVEVSIEFEDKSQTQAVTYIATEANPNFLGEDSAQNIAEQIVRSVGPSGDNKAYILHLDETLTAHDVCDSHVTEIAELVRHMEPRDL